MSEYIFLYRNGERMRSPEEMQQVMQAWMAWFRDLTATGYLKDMGQPLEREGKLVAGKQRAITDGPFTETKDVIGGYSIVEARDLDHATELTRGCPIFEIGGAVEVRPVMKMSM